MSSDEHRQAAAGQGSVPIAIVTVSDTRTPDTDISGQLLRSLVESAGHTVVDYRIVKDEPDQVLQAPAGLAAALEHERKVSESIRELYREAEAAGDLDSRPLLNWFIDEQIEEEATVGEIIGRLKLIGDEGLGLIKLDEDLGQRPAGSTEAPAE